MFHRSRFSRFFTLPFLANATLECVVLTGVVLTGVVSNNASVRADDEKPLEIAAVKHEGEVDFEKEVLPILRRSCLACHNTAEAESDLILETPKTILAGGAEGPGAVAGKGDESLILQLAAHQRESFMPPEDNDVGAKDLTPQELGLLKLWIDQGAKGEVTGGGPVRWRPLPAGVNPIYSAAISADGQTIATGRANQVFLHQGPSKRSLGRLSDPALAASPNEYGPAHLDLVQALTFSPDGNTLVSGGYRTVKIWRRTPAAAVKQWSVGAGEWKVGVVSANGALCALAQPNGQIKIVQLADGAVKHTLQGPASDVLGLAFSKDNATLAAIAADKSLRLWNVADGKPVANAELAAVSHAVAFVGSAGQIAVGRDDGVVRLWSIKAGEKVEGQDTPSATLEAVAELKGHAKAVHAIALTAAQAEQFATADEQGIVIIWDAAQKKQIRKINHGEPVTGLAWTADGKTLATAGGGKTLTLWQAADGKKLADLRGDYRTRLSVAAGQRAVSLAKKYIVGAKADVDAANKTKTAEEANVKKSGEAIKKAEEALAKSVEAVKKPLADKQAAEKVVVAAKAKLEKAKAAVVAADKTVAAAVAAVPVAEKARDAAKKEATLPGPAVKLAQEFLASVEKAAAANKADVLLAAIVVDVKKLVSQAKARRLAQVKKAIVDAEAAVKAAVAAKTKSEAGKKTAVAAVTAVEKEIKTAEAAAKKTTDAYDKAVAAQKAGERAVAGAKRNQERAKKTEQQSIAAIPPLENTHKQFEEALKAREADLKKLEATAVASERPWSKVAFSAAGDLLTAVDGGGQLHVWDVASSAPLAVVPAGKSGVNTIAFSGDQLVALAANGEIVVQDLLPAWKLERTIGSATSGEFADRVTALDISTDGTLLATGGGEPSRSGEVKIWNLATGALVLDIKDAHSDTVFGLQFSPNDKQLATCGADRFMKVFTVATGELVRSFEGHTHHVLDVAWQADGRRLATCGADNVIKVWDARTGDQLRTIAGYKKEVTSVDFIGDSDTVVAASGDPSVRIKNTSNGGNIRNFAGPADFVYAVGVSADGKTIIAGGQDSVLRVWTSDGKEFAKFSPPAPQSNGSGG